MKKFRIVTDNIRGYTIEEKSWYFPIWLEIPSIDNTFRTVQEAEKWLEKYKSAGKVVNEL